MTSEDKMILELNSKKLRIVADIIDKVRLDQPVSLSKLEYALDCLNGVGQDVRSICITSISIG